MHDVVVIGGGVIGMSIARELAGRKSVLLLDRGSTGQGTSRAAAGMLTPLSEADDQGPFFQLSRASHALYDRFVLDLQSETGLDVGYSTEGLLCMASSEEASKTLQCRFEWQNKAGFDVKLVSAAEVRQMEPLVTLTIRAAAFIPGELSVTPRHLVNALRESCFNRGVEIRTGLHVERIAQNQVWVGHLTLETRNIVIASGVWSAQLAGLDPPIPVSP